MAHLTTVPSFIFPNGEEQPIKVSYYNGSIELSQLHLGCKESDNILLSPEIIKPFLTEILKHLPEAEKYLKRGL